MMNFNLKITDVKTIHEIKGYWTSDDYVSLLEEFDYDDAQSSDPSELRELLEMAISELEPHESAEILLRYKLQGELSNGQIENLSHEMVDDDEAEEYPNIALHYALFNINQLLYRSYNGIFPNTKATKIEFDLNLTGGGNLTVTKEIVLKAMSKGLSDTNLVVRLFEDQLNGEAPFPEGEKIIWELHNHGQHQYTLITSDYWLNDEDIIDYIFSGSIRIFEDNK
jgi:hypothetical protein